MIRINLLPPEYEAAQAKKEQRILLSSVGGLSVVLLLLFWGIQVRRVNALEKKVAETEANLREFQAIVSQIEQIEADKQRLAAKRDVIRNLNRSRLIYPVFFEDLLPVIPSDVWITNVQVTEQGTQMRISMNSFAHSNFALATWLTNLQQSPHFSNVDLGPISYSSNEQFGTTLSFTLSCVYQHKGPFPLSDVN